MKRIIIFYLFFSLISKMFSLSIEQAEKIVRENDITWDIGQKQVTSIVSPNNEECFIMAEEDSFTGYVYYLRNNRLIKKYPCMNLLENKSLGKWSNSNDIWEKYI